MVGLAVAAGIEAVTSDFPRRCRDRDDRAQVRPGRLGAQPLRVIPGGDRQANHALWRIVLTRMSAHPPTLIYVERRTKEGLSKKEIIRCLKRYVAREVYRHLRAAG